MVLSIIPVAFPKNLFEILLRMKDLEYYFISEMVSASKTEWDCLFPHTGLGSLH